MVEREHLTRSPSTAPSAMSNIDVALSESGSSTMDHASPSRTPATSVTDGSAADNVSVKLEPSAVTREPSAQSDTSNSRRSVRSRSSVESYNLAKLSDICHGKQVAKVKNTRSFSGDTLVGDSTPDEAGSPGQRRRLLEGEVEKALQMDWQVGGLSASSQTTPAPSTIIGRSKSTSRGKLAKAAEKVSSALGKRPRDSLTLRRSESASLDNRRQSSRKSDVIVRVQELEDEHDEGSTIGPPAKKTRLLDTITEITSSLGRAASTKKPRKNWLTQGLYSGQEAEYGKTAAEAAGEAGNLTTSQSAPALPRRHMPYPMYSAGTREANFRIPYDIFAPLKRKENPKEWKKLSRNLFTPDAKEVWRTKKLERSMCLCRPPAPDSQEEGCDENCLNRTMLYECDENNCAIGPELCTNRAFADLAKRTKKGNVFDIGVEIIKTKECGFGLRANRSFAPGQIIIEYCGEVITPEESDRRMHNVYKDKNVSF